MEKISEADLIKQIEDALRLDTFIPYNHTSDFIDGFERVKDKIDILLENGKVRQAVYCQAHPRKS